VGSNPTSGQQVATHVRASPKVSFGSFEQAQANRKAGSQEVEHLWYNPCLKTERPPHRCPPGRGNALPHGLCRRRQRGSRPRTSAAAVKANARRRAPSGLCPEGLNEPHCPAHGAAAQGDERQGNEHESGPAQRCERQRRRESASANHASEQMLRQTFAREHGLFIHEPKARGAGQLLFPIMW
jgi:hypothetical protein